MSRLVCTGDGSFTFFHEKTGEHYHSMHGAVAESRHVFIDAGLRHLLSREAENVRILEIGFGTGLNFLLTADLCMAQHRKLDYTGIEAFPLSLTEISDTGYSNYINTMVWRQFLDHYDRALDVRALLSPRSTLQIFQKDISVFDPPGKYDLVYFDAFSPFHQPEMWKYEILEKCIDALGPGGIFVTYSVTGNLKRNLRKLGCLIERLPGAPGKREMLRATKPY